MQNKISQFPCPICKQIISIIGSTSKGKKIGSCGCTWKFKKSKSKKRLDNKYIETKDGFELKK